MKRLAFAVLFLLALAGCMLTGTAPGADDTTSSAPPETTAATAAPETVSTEAPVPETTEPPAPPAPPVLAHCVKMAVPTVLTVTPDHPRADYFVVFPRVLLPEEERSCSLTLELDGELCASWTELELSRSLKLEPELNFTFDLQDPDRTAQLVATLRYGDQTLTRSTTVTVDNDEPEVYYARSGESRPYAIDVLRNQNVVVVYGKTEAGYSFPVKVWLCSTGRSTPRGYFSLGGKKEWGLLFGAVWGQYTSGIEGNILFHSVPYKYKEKNSLKTEEYNKLGTTASMGCVRLPVVGAKWIFDNCPYGTSVHIYDVEELPVERPEAIVLDPEDPRSGWDPTDPDPENPWLTAIDD